MKVQKKKVPLKVFAKDPAAPVVRIGPASEKQSMFLNSEATISCCGGSAGSGKALRHGEKVLTPTGFINIEDVKVGALIRTPKNTTEEVTGVFFQGSVDIYRVTFQDGSTVDTCGEHLWNYHIARGSGKKITANTLELKRLLSVGKRPIVPLCEPVELPKLDLEIDPYTFGNLLSNSSNSFPKEIPWEYQNSCLKDRWDLMQGVMDIAGCTTTDGLASYSTNSPSLVEGLKNVLHSLGFIVNVTKNADKTDYILYINGNNLEKLCSTQGKSTLPKQISTGNRVVSVEYLTKDLATCIAISGEEKLFITSNYIVTHNTFTSLLIALKHMTHPRSTGVIFRRTQPMLTAPGSIWHEACDLFQTIYPEGLRIRHRGLEIVFPNGARLKFASLQHEKDKFASKGAQYNLVIFDEASDFSEDMVVYLLSRLRNANVPMKPQLYMMTNPAFECFLRLWLEDYYLDEKGIPLADRNGKLRYFFRQGNTMLWYNSLEEAEAIHGSGPESGITSFTFIGATCRDNPPLLQAQPDYISRLMSLPRVEMERLLLGSWYARLEASGLFKREWVKEVPYPNANARQRVRAWDLAFSQPSEVYPNPDYTAGVLVSKDASKIYTVEDVVRLRDRVHKVEELIFATAARDGKGTIITIPQDPNAAAGAYARDLQRRLAELGFHCKLVRPVQSKITRFAPFSSIAQAGFVQVVIADWNKDFYEELEIFNGDKKNKDDMVDCSSDCMFMLNRETIIPSMALPDLASVSSPTFNFGAPAAQVSLPSFNLR